MLADCRRSCLACQASPVNRPGFFVLATGCRRRAAGLTIVELITVIIIAGILAAVAIPRWGGQTGFEERVLRDETLAALRYAQKSAIAARRVVCAEFSATKVDFKIAKNAGATDCSDANPLMGPQGDAALVVTGRNASFSTFSNVTFDGAGRTAASMTITVGGMTDLPIRVEQETGYVH